MCVLGTSIDRVSPLGALQEGRVHRWPSPPQTPCRQKRREPLVPPGVPYLWRSSCCSPLPCPLWFLSMEHLCNTQPAGSICCPMTLGFSVASPSLAVVSYGIYSLSPPSLCRTGVLGPLNFNTPPASSGDLSLIAAPSEPLAERCSPAMDRLDSPLAVMLWSLSCGPLC